MVYGYSNSNYVNSVNSFYRYNHNVMRSSASSANTAGIRGNSTSSGNSYINSDAIKQLTTIRENASSMRDSLGLVTQATAFKKMYAESSKAENVAVNANSSPNSTYKDTQVEVKQTAAANVNEGSALKADEKFSGPAGTHRFEVEQDGKKYQFSVDVKAGDTNKAVQQRMAGAINSRNLGFTAAVSEDNASGTSTLSIRSANTGTDAKNEFTVRDMSGGNNSGSLVAATGVGSRTQTARDAVYSVNGGADRTSQTNNVSLGGGVSATLKNASPEAVTISAKRDTQASADAVKSLAESFNGLLGASKGNTKLNSDLTSAYEANAVGLARIGVTAGKDGKLSVDNDKLNKAASDGSLERFFGGINGSNSDFTGRLSQIAGTASAGGYRATQASTANAAQPAYSQQNLTNAYNYSRNNQSTLYNYMFGTSGGATIGTLFNLYA